MDAVEYIRAANRMCRGFSNCGECPCVTMGGKSCDDLEPERLVSITEQWAKENPIRTRQEEFLKMFPNAKIEDSGAIAICPTYINNMECGSCYTGMDCKECKKRYWFQEVGEE